MAGGWAGRSGWIVLASVLASFPFPVLAQSCKSEGGLKFVGKTADGQNSVWLSATIAGSFELQSAQHSQVVDDWSKQRRGLHVSVSPVVSNGNGGTHQLFDTGNGACMIDSQNQSGGITIPPNITFPGGSLPGHLGNIIGKFFPDFQMPGIPGPGVGNGEVAGATPAVPQGRDISFAFPADYKD